VKTNVFSTGKWAYEPFINNCSKCRNLVELFRNL
jgi:hypothetical protein